MSCSTVGMILFIKFAGGMGVSYQESVDLSTLPEGLLNSVQTELSEQKLSALTIDDKNQFATDSVMYELQYADSTKKFYINELDASDEMLELIDKLKPYSKLVPKPNLETE